MTGKYFAVLGLQLTLWGLAVLGALLPRGLFDWLGIDYGLFWAATQAFWSNSPASAYDLQVVTQYVQSLAAYYGQLADALRVGPTPYPPVFVLLFTPFIIPPPTIGFALWTLANAGLALYVLHGLATRFAQWPWGIAAIALTFFPLGYTLFVGQVTVILLFGLYQAYRAFEKGQDFRGGLFTGILLLKPQYAFLFVLVLVFKRRWAAVQGIIVVGIALLLSSLAILGPDGLLKYLGSLNYASGFRSVDPIVYPQQMISWRGVLVNFLPGVSETQGLVLTAVLSAITASALIVVWRGPWNPRDEHFAARVLATTIITLLVGFHSHVHGAALLLVPGLALASSHRCPPLVRAVMRVSLFLPTIIFGLTGWVTLVAIIFASLMLLALGAIVMDIVTPRQHRQAPSPLVAHAEASG